MVANIDEQYETEVDYSYKGKPWNILIPIAIFIISAVVLVALGLVVK